MRKRGRDIVCSPDERKTYLCGNSYIEPGPLPSGCTQGAAALWYLTRPAGSGPMRLVYPHTAGSLIYQKRISAQFILRSSGEQTYGFRVKKKRKLPVRAAGHAVAGDGWHGRELASQKQKKRPVRPFGPKKTESSVRVSGNGRRRGWRGAISSGICPPP